MKLTKKYVTGCLSRHDKVVMHCQSGDTVVFETRDCYDGSITSEDEPLGDGKEHVDNPATGPLYIEGAEVNDILKVEILDIVPGSHGIMRTSPTAGAFCKHYDERIARIFPIKNNQIEFDDKVTIPLTPMIGVIGTAPFGEGISTESPDYHGGNMDCNQITKGTVLYLPVCTKGALLSMGDLHGIMGDGEVLICGLEMEGEVTVRVSVIKEKELPTPFLVAKENVMTIQSAMTLDEAAELAANKMFDFLLPIMENNKINTGMLLSLKSNLVICQIVDPKKTVRCEFPKSILEQYGYQLP